MGLYSSLHPNMHSQSHYIQSKVAHPLIVKDDEQLGMPRILDDPEVSDIWKIPGPEEEVAEVPQTESLNYLCHAVKDERRRRGLSPRPRVSTLPCLCLEISCI